MEVNITKEKVEQMLKQKGISKAEFATQMGVHRQNLDALLKSQKKDINTIIKMAEILEVPFDVFCGFTDASDPQPQGIIKFHGHYYDINSKEDVLKLLDIMNNKTLKEKNNILFL